MDAKEKLLLALEQLIKGAPGMWEQLVYEVQMRGVAGAVLFGIACIVTSWITVSLAKKPEEMSDIDVAFSFSTALAALLSFAAMGHFLMKAVSPSLELLQTITGQ